MLIDDPMEPALVQTHGIGVPVGAEINIGVTRQKVLIFYLLLLFYLQASFHINIAEH